MGRPDGKRVKDMDPAFKIIPNLMEHRHDSQVFYSIDVPLDEITKYIKDKRDKGINVGYMHVLYLMFIRVINDRKKLNRFVMQNRMYQRDKIIISMTVKQSMNEDADEGNTKCYFEGNESIEEVINILNEQILQEKADGENGETAKFINTLTKIPEWLSRMLVKTLMFLDRRDLLPKSIIEVSPFHATAYFTNVGSIGLDSVHHHLYDFGTIGMFIAMGKKFQKLIVENDVVKEATHVKLSIVIDERVVDGFYFSSAVRLLKRYIKNPFLLDEEVEDEKMSKIIEDEKIQMEKVLKEIEGKEDIEKESEEIFKKSFFPNFSNIFNKMNFNFMKKDRDKDE